MRRVRYLLIVVGAVAVATGGMILALGLAGAPTAGAATISPSSFDFGTVMPGARSATVLFTVTGQTGDNFHVGFAGPDDPPFEEASDTCEALLTGFVPEVNEGGGGKRGGTTQAKKKCKKIKNKAKRKKCLKKQRGSGGKSPR